MGFANLIRNGVALASSLTSDLQATVTHRAWMGETGDGEDSFANPVSYKAIVDPSRRQKFTSSGVLVNVLATITFLDPVTRNGAANRQEPIDPRDVITLPDGTTAPIVDVNGFWDAGQSRPFLNVVTLGFVVERLNG